MNYGKNPIEREDATELSAHFASYKIFYGKNLSITDIKLFFHDYAPLYIDGACVGNNVLNDLESLPDGATVNMLIHPKSDTILEIKQGNNIILPFEDAKKNIKSETIAFSILGILIYILATVGLASLIKNGIRVIKYRKNGKRNRTST